MKLFNRIKRKKLSNQTIEELSHEPLSSEERAMIKGVISLEETCVTEAMVPRIDAIFINANTQLSELLRIISETGFSRYPVYEEKVDNVVGILYVKDLLQPLLLHQESISIKEMCRVPFFVPDSKKLDSLLREFKKRHVHIAVAVDEYGGVSGILCLEDIIELIVGDIQDEYDNEAEELQVVNAHTYLCDARMRIDELNEELQLNLPQQNFDTLGGFVYNLFGKIPSLLEEVTYEDTLFIVQELDEQKIKIVKIVKKEV
jgi:magnesium and cobalt transporter